MTERLSSGDHLQSPVWVAKTLVSIEGIDGTGKTETVEKSLTALADQGLDATSVSDPPHIPPWDRLKNEVLDRSNGLSPPAEAWTYLSARLDAVQREVIPALADGAFVVADRYVDSWVAYHAHRIRGPKSFRESLSFLDATQRTLSRAHLLPFPGRTWLIHDTPRRALARVKGERSKWEDPETLRRVAAAYALLAERYPRRVSVVAVGNRTLDDVQEQIVREVVAYFARVSESI